MRKIELEKKRQEASVKRKKTMAENKKRKELAQLEELQKKYSKKES